MVEGNTLLNAEPGLNPVVWEAISPIDLNDAGVFALVPGNSKFFEDGGAQEQGEMVGIIGQPVITVDSTNVVEGADTDSIITFTGISDGVLADFTSDVANNRIIIHPMNRQWFAVGQVINDMSTPANHLVVRFFHIQSDTGIFNGTRTDNTGGNIFNNVFVNWDTDDIRVAELTEVRP